MTLLFSPVRDEDGAYRIGPNGIRYDNDPLQHGKIESPSLDGLACELMAKMSKLGRWSSLKGSGHISLETELTGKIMIPFSIMNDLGSPLTDEPTPDIMALADARAAAKQARDFSRADEIRNELEDRGWSIRDTPKGPTLRRIK